MIENTGNDYQIVDIALEVFPTEGDFESVEWERVQGIGRGGLAVFYSGDTKFLGHVFNVAHVGSGRSICYADSTIDGLLIIEQLLRIGFDWTQCINSRHIKDTNISTEQYIKLERIVERARTAIEAESKK